MRRSYLAYLIVAVLPSVAAATAGVVVSRGAWQGLRTTSWAWIGTTALNALQEDLVGTVSSLAAAGEPTPVDPEDPAWARVSRGDTVSALRPRGSGVEVMVLTGPRPGDPPGSLRYAGAPLPTAPLAVARATGSRLSLYLNGRRAMAVEDPPGPDTLPRQTLVALSAAQAGLPVSSGDGGVLVALDHPVGRPPSLAVMVAPSTRPGPPVPGTILVVLALFFVFALLGGWIHLGAARNGTGERRRSIVLISLVPVLTAVGFLVHVDRRFQEAARTLAARDLTQALAVASARGIHASPTQIRELTGFHAARVRDGSVEETTLGQPLDAVATLPAPPPSFTSSGTVATSEGTSFYVALRLADGAFVMASSRRPDARIRAFRKELLVVAASLAAWLLVAGWMAGVGAPPEPATAAGGPAASS